ncbi:MAG: hypothetical protein ACK5LZ_07010 [Anaerorhabdus sp.]
MNREKMESILKGRDEEYIQDQRVWKDYIECKRKLIGQMEPKCVDYCMISEANWLMRNQALSCEELGVQVRVGDICYIDFGQAYINEAGFQHFGLILSVYQKKAFVVPMTSNIHQYKTAYDPKSNEIGKRHLMKIGLIAGMNRPSVLFLNDCKYINTARIIDVKAHIVPTSLLFDTIKKRIQELVF